MDDEIHVYESRLADLDVELRQIKALLHSERDRAAKPEEPSVLNATALGKIKAALPWVGSDQLALLVYHLGNSQFKWRNQDTISHETGFHAQVIDDLVGSVPERIILAKSKLGKVIYRPLDQAKGQLMQIDLMAN